jgi:hypothetical protein
LSISSCQQKTQYRQPRPAFNGWPLDIFQNTNPAWDKLAATSSASAFGGNSSSKKNDPKRNIEP